MGTETTVTRGCQVTLTKEIREKLDIKEGDRLVMNVEGNRITMANKDSSVFDRLEPFLSDDFDVMLKKMRSGQKERMKRLGIME